MVLAKNYASVREEIGTRTYHEVTIAGLDVCDSRRELCGLYGGEVGIEVMRVAKFADVGNDCGKSRDVMQTMGEEGQLTWGAKSWSISTMIPVTVAVYDKPTARGHVWVGTIRQRELARDGELEVEQSSR